MKLKVFSLCAGLCLAMAPLGATTVFDFTTGYLNQGSLGDSIVMDQDGLTLTVTAWGVTGSSNTEFQDAALGQYYGYGLGVCDQNEIASCSTPQHEVDNDNGYDFVLFQFSNPINSASIVIDPVDGVFGRDVTYYTGNLTNPASSLPGETLSQLIALGFTGPVDDNSTASINPRTVTLSDVNNGVTSILFGASTEPGNTGTDFFKIRNLTIDSQVTPEPATFGLVGGALLLFGAIRRRKSSRPM